MGKWYEVRPGVSENDYCRTCYAVTRWAIVKHQAGLTYGIGRMKVATHTQYAALCSKCDGFIPLSKELVREMQQGTTRFANLVYQGAQFIPESLVEKYPEVFRWHVMMERLLDQAGLEYVLVGLGSFVATDIQLVSSGDAAFASIEIVSFADVRPDLRNEDAWEDFIAERNAVAVQPCFWSADDEDGIEVSLSLKPNPSDAEELVAALNVLLVEAHRADIR
ncbi:MAG: hypothetical protein WKF96_02060 [Solirubrobacteraceae bacterium]